MSEANDQIIETYYIGIRRGLTPADALTVAAAIGTRTGAITSTPQSDAFGSLINFSWSLPGA